MEEKINFFKTLCAKLPMNSLETYFFYYGWYRYVRNVKKKIFFKQDFFSLSGFRYPKKLRTEGRNN